MNCELHIAGRERGPVPRTVTHLAGSAGDADSALAAIADMLLLSAQQADRTRHRIATPTRAPDARFEVAWYAWPAVPRAGRQLAKEVVAVPKYLWKASYTAAGVKGVAAEGGSSRRESVGRALGSVGGTLEAFYFAFGDADVYAIADLPDNEAATAMALAINGSGAVTVETIPLLTPEEVDAASKKSVEYRAAGG
jgi:uncharacterized protein with GYD domain